MIEVTREIREVMPAMSRAQLEQMLNAVLDDCIEVHIADLPDCEHSDGMVEQSESTFDALMRMACGVNWQTMTGPWRRSEVSRVR